MSLCTGCRSDRNQAITGLNLELRLIFSQWCCHFKQWKWKSAPTNRYLSLLISMVVPIVKVWPDNNVEYKKLSALAVANLVYLLFFLCVCLGVCVLVCLGFLFSLSFPFSICVGVTKNSVFITLSLNTGVKRKIETSASSIGKCHLICRCQSVVHLS